MIILAILCALVGVVGAIVPGIPGPPVAWLALLFVQLSDRADLSPTLLWVTAALAVIITVMDYLVPAWGARSMGGTKAGVRGSNIGLIVSLFVLPLLGIVVGPFGLVGMLAGPFVGAWMGESLGGNRQGALRAACGTFLGFLAGTFIKLVFGLFVAVKMVLIFLN